MKSKKQESKDVRDAKKAIKTWKMPQLVAFIRDMALEGFVLVDSNTHKKTLTSMRQKAFAAIENMYEKIKSGEITEATEAERMKPKEKSNLILDPNEGKTILPATNRFRFKGDI